MVESIHPVIPTSDGHAIAIGVLTYRDSLHFAAYVDPDALPDATELGPLFRSAVSELEHAVVPRPAAAYDSVTAAGRLAGRRASISAASRSSRDRTTARTQTVVPFAARRSPRLSTRGPVV